MFGGQFFSRNNSLGNKSIVSVFIILFAICLTLTFSVAFAAPAEKKNVVVIKSNGKCAVNIAAALELTVSSDKNFILLKVFEGKIFRTDDNPAAQKINFIQAQISKSCEDGDCFVSISSGDKLTKTYTIEKSKSVDISGLQFKIPSPLKYELDKDSWLTIHIETQDSKGKSSCYAHSKNYIGDDLSKMIFGK